MYKYLAYTFLYDDTADLRCDFEILSDEISSMIGLLRSLIDNTVKGAGVLEDAGIPDDTRELREDLAKINELMYHINPSIRAGTAVTEEELAWLYERTAKIQEEVKDCSYRFVVPQGCTPAAYSHVIRSKCKSLVRLLSRHKQQGHPVDDIVFDFINLYSNYFFVLALKLNKAHGVEELEFISRAYRRNM
jgi:cob(I)alamin adenosyltransferase